MIPPFDLTTSWGWFGGYALANALRINNKCMYMPPPIVTIISPYMTENT